MYASKVKEQHFLTLVDSGLLSVYKDGRVVNNITHHTFIGKDGKGYGRVNIRYNGKTLSMLRHRLVWLVHKNRYLHPDIEINHIRGVSGEDWIKNLEEVTASENMQHAVDNKLLPAPKGELNGNAAFTDIQDRSIRCKYRIGKTSIDKICNDSNAHPLTVKDMLYGKTYKHIKSVVRKPISVSIHKHEHLRKERWLIIKPLFIQGVSGCEIAKRLNLPASTVNKLICRYGSLAKR